MNQVGCLLDTGPLVALLSHQDQNHERAKKLFSEFPAPFRTCEAVIAEACYLLSKVHPDAPQELISLAQREVFVIGLQLKDHWNAIHSLLKKYHNRPISLADACLIRCAEEFQEPRILTFDSDFTIYRWDKNRPFVLIH